MSRRIHPSLPLRNRRLQDNNKQRGGPTELCILSSVLLSLILLLLECPVTIAIRITPSSRDDFHSIPHRVLESDDSTATMIGNNDLHNNNSSSQQRKLVRVNVAEHPEEHLVHSLPLLEDNLFTTPHWAGLLPASGNYDKYFFYWLFGPDTFGSEDDANIPLIIWLNGGPGCSSMDGLFIENGPFQFVLENPNERTSAWKLSLNEFSWHKLPAYVVYIDQPVGTGLSFTTSGRYPSNDERVNIDFYYFLKEFLKLHSDKFLTSDKKSTRRPIYFTGESHAGHYIPSMMAYILKQNDKPNADMHIELSGAAIGNGWMDPYHQYAAAAAAYGHGILGRAQVAALDLKEQQCQKYLKEGKLSNGLCFDLLDDIVKYSIGSANGYKVSQYDVRKIERQAGQRTFPEGHKVVEAYLGGLTTGSDGGFMQSNIFHLALEALHAKESRDAGQNYKECTDPPYDALAHQDGKGVVDDVIYLLEHSQQKVRLLFFNGIEDLICNHVGNEIFLENMEWTHQQDYIASHRYAWRSPASEDEAGKINGYMKQYNNHLLFLKLLDSGHMVPMDLPHIALSMMQIFVNDKDSTTCSFEQYEQKINTADARQNPTCPVCEDMQNKYGNENNDNDEEEEISNTNGNDNCPPPNTNTTTAGSGEDENGSSVLQSSSANMSAPVGVLAGTTIIAFTWVGAFVVIGMIIIVLYYKRGGLRRTTTRAQYDMELRERGGSGGDGLYRDGVITASDVETEDVLDSEDSIEFPSSSTGNGYARKKQID